MMTSTICNLKWTKASVFGLWRKLTLNAPNLNTMKYWTTKTNTSNNYFIIRLSLSGLPGTLFIPLVSHAVISWYWIFFFQFNPLENMLSSTGCIVVSLHCSYLTAYIFALITTAPSLTKWRLSCDSPVSSIWKSDNCLI